MFKIGDMIKSKDNNLNTMYDYLGNGIVIDIFDLKYHKDKYYKVYFLQDNKILKYSKFILQEFFEILS